MSKRLAPFSVALAYPSDPTRSSFANLVPPLQKKMDLAANPVLKAFLAGSLSGTCSTILFQPLDLVKTRQQNIQNLHTQGRGMITVIRHVLQTERVMGLWRGIMPSIARTVPGVGLYFGSLHWLKNQALGSSEPSPVQAICLGMAARSLAGCVMIPITVIKTRFESGIYNYHRISQALAQIYSKEGIRGLCCGLVPTLVRDAPFSGLYLMFYTQLKQLLAMNRHSDTAGGSSLHPIVASTAHFSCGVTAGILASMVTHPADVIKTRMQLDPIKNHSVRATVVRVFRDTGVRGFMVGLAPRMLRRTLMSALAWTVYEEIMRQLGLK